MGRTNPALVNHIHTKKRLNMTLEEVEQLAAVEQELVAPIPDGKKKRKAKKAKKSKKAKKGKRARGGKTIAQCVVAALKKHMGAMSAAAIRKAIAKQGAKVGSFILGKVLLRLNRRRVLKKTKRGYRLTGKALPKPRTLAQKRAAMAKARRALGKKKSRSGKKKAAKKSKKSKKARRNRRK